MVYAVDPGLICLNTPGNSNREEEKMATQVIDTDGHIFERDEIMFDCLEAPYRGRKEVFLYPFFPPPDGFHRMARRIIDQRPYIVGADDPKTWVEIL